MADFVKVMQDWERMCESKSGGCEGCPVDAFTTDVVCPVAVNGRDLVAIDQAVEAWVAEHPEPVYPTWGEWFAGRGDLTKNWRSIRTISDAGTPVGIIGFLHDRIPADIAEKLGIEPREGT